MEKESIKDLQVQVDSGFDSLNEDLKKKLDDGTFTYEDARVYMTEKERILILSKYSFDSLKPMPSDGRYHIKVRNHANPQKRISFAAKTLDELKDKVYGYEITGSRAVTKDLMTFNDALELSFEEKIKFCKNKDRLPSVINTVSRMRCDYNRFIAGTDLADIPVKLIQKKDLEKVLDNAVTEFHLRAKAFNNLKGVIRQALKYAYNNGIINEIVLDRIPNDKYKNSFEDKVPLSCRMHSEEELKQMLNEIKVKHAKKPDYMPAYALELQILTELRRGEVAPLMWSDMNIKDGYFIISKEQITEKPLVKSEKERFVIVNRTKNGKQRAIPIYSLVKPLIDEIKAVHDKYYPNSKYLFPDCSQENGCINNRVVYEYYFRICKKLGIEISRDFIKGTHSFRKNISTKIASKYGAEIASEIAGNSRIVLETNYNAGMSIEQKTEIMEAVNSSLNLEPENLYPKNTNLYPNNVVRFVQKKERKPCK